MPVLARLLLVVMLAACAAVPADAPTGVPDGAQAAVVDKVVDGDTIWVRVDSDGGSLPAGERHKVRLLEMDTPEVGRYGGTEECFGEEATAFAERHMAVGSAVWLVEDREETDRYGRHLRYVWTADGRFFNELAVEEGFATAELYEPNDAYIDVLEQAEAQARAAGRGLWNACSLP